MYIYFFRNTASANQEIEDRGLETGYSLRVIKPSPLQPNNFFWYLLNLFSPIQFSEFQILNPNKEVVAYAKVIGKIYKFPFMIPKSIHIGPCLTVEEERGKGLYPYLLNHILQTYKDTQAFMIVKEENLPSIKGVTKVGFKPFAKGHMNSLREYVIDHYL